MQFSNSNTFGYVQGINYVNFKANFENFHEILIKSLENSTKYTFHFFLSFLFLFFFLINTVDKSQEIQKFFCTGTWKEFLITKTIEFFSYL